MGLIQKFRAIDVDEKGSVPRQDVVKAIQDQGEASYDQVRETLKEVNLDSSGRVELDDYVDVSSSGKPLRPQCRGACTAPPQAQLWSPPCPRSCFLISCMN